MSESTEATDPIPMPPRVIGAGIYAYVFFQRAAGEHLPNPDEPEDVDAVIESVAIYTSWDRERLELFRPAIEACIRSLVVPPDV